MTLVDLLEKSTLKSEPPVLNGSLRFGDKGLELVNENIGCTISIPESAEASSETESIIIIKDDKSTLKRAGDDLDSKDSKKPCLAGEVHLKEDSPEDGNTSSNNFLGKSNFFVMFNVLINY